MLLTIKYSLPAPVSLLVFTALSFMLLVNSVLDYSVSEQILSMQSTKCHVITIDHILEFLEQKYQTFY